MATYRTLSDGAAEHSTAQHTLFTEGEYHRYNSAMRIISGQLRAWTIGLFVPPYWKSGAHYLSVSEWARTFRSSDARHGELALEQARRNYDEASKIFEGLDAKSAQLLQTAGTMGTIVFAAIAGFKLPVDAWMTSTFVLLLASMAIAIFGRWPMLRPTPAGVRELMAPLGDPAALKEGEFHQIPNPEAWLAASLEATTMGLRGLEEWKSRNVRVASVLVALAMLCLVPAIARQ
jgi:hypothetical protein